MGFKFWALSVAPIFWYLVAAYVIAGWSLKRKWYKRIAAVSSSLDKAGAVSEKGNWFRRWTTKNIQLYRQAGYSEAEAKKLVIGYGVIGAVLSAVAAMLNPIRALLVLLLLELIRRGRLKQYKRAFEAKFNMNLYKIYRFLCTQLLSGHSAVEILRHIHLAAPDKDMKSALNAFTGAYFRTLDFDRASAELTQRYPTKASETLLIILRQGIESGEAVEMIQRQEEVMIQKYLESVSLEQEKLQFNLILLIAASGSITFAVMAIPLVLQMLEALESLFV